MMNKTFCLTCINAYREEANKLEDFNMVNCVINNSILVLLFYIKFVLFYFSTLIASMQVTEDDK